MGGVDLTLIDYSNELVGSKAATRERMNDICYILWMIVQYLALLVVTGVAVKDPSHISQLQGWGL